MKVATCAIQSCDIPGGETTRNVADTGLGSEVIGMSSATSPSCEDLCEKLEPDEPMFWMTAAPKTNLAAVAMTVSVAATVAGFAVTPALPEASSNGSVGFAHLYS